MTLSRMPLVIHGECLNTIGFSVAYIGINGEDHGIYHEVPWKLGTYWIQK